MEKPECHFLICSSSRVNGEPKGVCNRKSAAALIQFLETEIGDRGIENTLVTNTGCLKLCDQGPIMIIYPQGHWYKNLTEENIERILDALEQDETVADLLI